MTDAFLAQPETLTLYWHSVLAPDHSRYTYAEWVRELSDRSGVYLIRAEPTRFRDELLYIGESHTHHTPAQTKTFQGLYRTLTRHFNTADWDEGLTYDPEDVLVAVILTPPEMALDYQDALIARYQPRDNELALQIRSAR